MLARAGSAHRRNDLDAAEQDYRAILAVVPDHPVALHYLGMLMVQRGQLDAALPLLDRSVAAVPGNAEFHGNRGIALGAMQRDHEAVESFRRALAIAPDHAGNWNNLGLALVATGNLTGAIDAYRRSLELAPDAPQTHWNLALALLLLGEYDEGFREYEWRLRTPELSPFLRERSGPRWDGSDLSGKTLLVTVEQGLGDTLQNIRFAAALAARGARVVAAVQPALRNLVATVPGVALAVAADDALPDYDAWIPLMSVPGMLRVQPGDLAGVRRYLTPDTHRAVEAKRAVEAAAPTELRVGIAWTGAPGNPYNRRRACALKDFASMFELAGVRWFSLQREGEGLFAGDASLAERLASLPMRNDLDGTAALIDALDLVISVDTSLVHLAGALGKPVWVLLPFAPDWRWMLGREDSHWYPTARLFRQPVTGDWQSVFAVAAEELRQRLRATPVRR